MLRPRAGADASGPPCVVSTAVRREPLSVTRTGPCDPVVEWGGNLRGPTPTPSPPPRAADQKRGIGSSGNRCKRCKTVDYDPLAKAAGEKVERPQSFAYSGGRRQQAVGVQSIRFPAIVLIIGLVLPSDQTHVDSASRGGRTKMHCGPSPMSSPQGNVSRKCPSSHHSSRVIESCPTRPAL